MHPCHGFQLLCIAILSNHYRECHSLGRGRLVILIAKSLDLDRHDIGAFLQSLIDSNVSVLGVDLEILLEFLLVDTGKLVCQSTLCVADRLTRAKDIKKGYLVVFKISFKGMDRFPE